MDLAPSKKSQFLSAVDPRRRGSSWLTLGFLYARLSLLPTVVTVLRCRMYTPVLLFDPLLLSWLNVSTACARTLYPSIPPYGQCLHEDRSHFIWISRGIS